MGLFQGREHGFVLGSRHWWKDNTELAVELIDRNLLVVSQEGMQGQFQAIEPTSRI